jgi:subtilisin family serine protease
VQAARQTYGEAVRNLEANNNSVVVSVGNQGQILDNFAADAGGQRIQSSPDSAHNVLVNPDVTTVGSTRWFDNGTERIANYNSPDPETDIYASGSVGNGQDPNRMNVLGTSFASPRVAGAMAALHGNHPGMPSSAVENLMRNRLTHETQGEKVLDFNLAEQYMRQGTF